MLHRLARFTLLLALWLLPSAATAEVHFVGTWPEEPVTLDLRGSTRTDAVRALAAKSGWSLVARDLGAPPVEVDVHDVPAQKVLETLLSGADFEVTRDGSLITILPLTPSAPSAQLSAAAPASTIPGPLPLPTRTPRAPEVQNDDLLVTDFVRIGPNDIVTDVIVWRGRLEVAGQVTGDIGAFGSDVVLLPGARVSGDAVSFGGSLTIQNGAEVGGDTAPVFAAFERGDQVRVRCSTCRAEPSDPPQSFVDLLFERLTGACLFWLFGALLLAVSPHRTECVRAELTRRPLRCLGFGLLGLVGLVLVLATLAITLIGIPLALLVALTAVVSAYVGLCIVIWSVGRLLVGQRSTNPYLQLALGCAVFFVTRWIPGIDGIAIVLGLLGAIGALVLTRGGGILGTPALRADT